MLERGEESPYTEWIERIDPDADVGKRLTAIEISATIRRGRDALRAHRTQVDPDGFWFRVPEQVVLASYPYEDFELMAARVPVEPRESSLFDGISVA
jgi:mycothiol S-conjugate amidase